MKSLLKKVALVLVLVMVLAGWFVRQSHQHPTLTFESKPRAVFNDLQLSASQKPQIAISPSGMMTVLAVVGAEDQERLALTTSHDGGDTFSPPVAVSEDQAVVKAHGENSPSLAQTGMAIYATWQQQVGDGKAQIVFARSTNMGRIFEKPVVVTDKQQPSFNGFSTMKVAPNGDIYVVWLDGRDQAQPKGTFAVYIAKSTDKGASFGPNQRVTLGACPCCRPTIAFGDKGEVYVSWRKVFDGDIRDMVVAKSDGGKSFSDPVKIADDHWVLHACPDSGPSLIQTGGKLYAAWYSEGNEKPGVRVAVSSDAGHSFSSFDMASKHVLDTNHPQLSVSDDGHVALTFIGRSSAGKGESWTPLQAFVATVDDSGSVSEPQALALAHRSAAYPAILSASGGRLFMGWTEFSGEVPQAEFVRGRINN
jgi:hypothetical protein